MTSNVRWLRRAIVAAVAVPIMLGAFLPSSADAATRLFVVANELATIWEIDPLTANKIAETQVVSPDQQPATRVGLAFDGTYLYYADENHNGVQAYIPGGALDRTLPQPPGVDPPNGLGATKTTVFLVGPDNVITEINSTTGAVVNSFTIPGAAQGLTFAGSRNSLFVVVNDSPTVKEVSTAGAVLNTITADDVFRGLAFSSSSKILYGVRAGFLWAVDPTNGATLPGYPKQIHDDATGLKLTKSAGAAADEPVLEECGDETVNGDSETCDPPSSTQTNGQVCRADCTYCGDGQQDTSEQCDDGNTDNNDDCRNDCTLPRCGDGVLDENEGCDDGCLAGAPNVCEPADDGDGCSSTCTIEEYCGDGIVQPQRGEQCELPNTPGCDAQCHATEICTDLTDNDGDGSIDCLDEDCDCLPIGRDPGALRFGPTDGTDLFAVHGSLDPNSALNPTTEEIKFLLTNVNGKIFQLVIPAGDVKQIGRNLYRFRDQLAQRQRHGLARFDLRYYPKRDTFTFVVKAYGDLSAATVADMSLQLVIGNDAFLNQSTWGKTPRGWTLSLPGE